MKCVPEIGETSQDESTDPNLIIRSVAYEIKNELEFHFAKN